MIFKKIYVEITNVCNLNCSFCIGHQREKRFMSIEEFKIILNKLQGYTKYLYFHVMGEPLLHPLINEFIDEAACNYFVNITTNGYLIKRVGNNKNIRQINISLHDFFPGKEKSIEQYLDDIFSSSELLAGNGTIVCYRMWSKNPNKEAIIEKINAYYESRIDGEFSTKIKDNIFYEVEQEFVWPSLSNDYYSESGSCYGTRTHIGILVDGSVVPCCLDSAGLVNLGNIYKSDLNDIIGSEFFLQMKNNFLNNKKIVELCKHCSFKRNMER